MIRLPCLDSYSNCIALEVLCTTHTGATVQNRVAAKLLHLLQLAVATE